jgi:hypothetical protein
MRNNNMHLTNYSINKMSNDYVRCTPEQLLEPNNATKRTFKSLFASLKADGVDVEKVK